VDVLASEAVDTVPVLPTGTVFRFGMVSPSVAADAQRLIVRSADRERASTVTCSEVLGWDVGQQSPFPGWRAAPASQDSRAAAIASDSVPVEAVVVRLTAISHRSRDTVLVNLSPRRLWDAADGQAVATVGRMGSWLGAAVPGSLHARSDVRASRLAEYNRRARSQRVTVPAPALPMSVAKPTRETGVFATVDRAGRHDRMVNEVWFGGEQ
jgi:hypothetical protein